MSISGNFVARRTIEKMRRDGMNHLGDEGGVRYNRKPYADTTGYTPVNHVNKLIDPSRWQPLVVEHYEGTYRVQSFLTPQFATLKPRLSTNVEQFEIPSPGRNLDGELGYQR